MEQPTRSLNELKIALAILQLSSEVGASRSRVISSTALIFCWRNCPPDTLIEVLQPRIKGKYPQAIFDVLTDNVDEIDLGRGAVDAEAFLSARVPSVARVPATIRHPVFKRAISDAVVFSAKIDHLIERLQRPKTAPDGAVIQSRNTYYSREPVPQNYTTYPIFYGTDRLLEPGRTVRFGGFRSDDTISVGIANVSIPHIHREGNLERPWLWPTQSKGSPNKHIVVHDNEVMALESWLASAKGYLSKLELGHDPSRKEGLLFIHGYNVSFDAALWRAAQLCHDLKYPGMMLCFSWASLGIPGAYPADEATVDWSAGNLRQYLRHVTEELGLSALHIVAHSMGNRALLSVLEGWTHTPGTTPIHQVVLAAPDVDSSRMEQLGKVFDTYEQVTLYASRHDRAIAVSRLAHRYPRAGDANPPLVMRYLSTVDVSAAGKDMFGLGHSYMANVSKVFRDLFYIVRHRHKPDQRAGIRKRQEGYWELT